MEKELIACLILLIAHTPTSDSATHTTTSTTPPCVTTPTPSTPAPPCTRTPATTSTPPTTPQPTSSYCNQSICQACPITAGINYPVVPLTCAQLVSNSPFFVFPLLNRPDLQDENSQCLTFKQLNNNTFLNFYTVTKKNGSISVSVASITDGPQGPGTYTLAGFLGNSAHIVHRYLVNVSCSGSSTIYSAITVTLATDCNIGNAQFNPALGFTSGSTVTKSCLAQSRQSLESYTGPRTTTTLRNRAPIGCVTDYLNSPVINAEALSNDSRVYRISYPSLVPSSVG